jgi:hypothetical protein
MPITPVDPAQLYFTYVVAPFTFTPNGLVLALSLQTLYAMSSS